MATSTKTPNSTEEQDAAYNPGDAYYNDRFNQIAKHPDMADLASMEAEALNEPSYDIRHGAYTDSHGDEVNSNYKADTPDPDSNIQSAKNQEEEASGIYRPTNEGSKLLLKGSGRNIKLLLPGIGVMFTLIIGLISSLLFGSASLFATLEKNLTNDSSDFDRTNIVLRRGYMGSFIGKADCTGSKLKCKITTATKSQVQSWVNEKFKINGTKLNAQGSPVSGNSEEIKIDDLKDDERVKVDKITFPNGNSATSNVEFERETTSNLESRRFALRAFNTKSSFFLNTKFNKVLSKFGLSKGRIAASDSKPSEKDKAEDKVRDATEKAKSKVGVSLDKLFKASGAISSPILFACTSYNVARVSVAIVKAQWVADIVAFALPFVQYASKIADGSMTDEDAADFEARANQLVWYPSSSYTDKQIETINQDSNINTQDKQSQIAAAESKENLTATDSQGLRMAMYGDLTALKDYTLAYTTGGIGAVAAVSQGISSVQQHLGKDNIRQACIEANRAGLVSATGQAAACIIGAISIIGGVGCLLKNAALAAAFTLAMYYGTQAATAALVKALKNADLPSDLKGVDAGNALAAGIGLMLSRGSLGYGMKPATSSDAVKKFITATDNDYQTYKVALEKDDAQKNPFDTSNQYSFAHQLLAGVTPYNSTERTGFSTVANMLSVASSSLIPKANALHSQPSLMTSTDENLNHRLNSCTDTDKKDIGVVCDWSGRIVGVSSAKVLGWAEQMAQGDPQPLYDTIDFMQQKGKFTNVGNMGEADGGTYDETCTSFNNILASLFGDCKEDSKKPSIDDDGATVADSEYSKYIKYCSEDRELEIGSSDEAIEAGSDRQQDWSTGKQCAKDSEMMDRFAFYFNFCESQYATANFTGPCYDSDATAPTQTTGDCAGGGTAAIYTCALKYDNYLYKWGGGHGGNAQDWIAKFNNGEISEWTDILDCSGLVRMAYVEAMGKEAPANVAPSGYDGDTDHWTKISLEEAKQGDIVTSSGHVAIVEANDTSGKKFKIFHASTSGSPREDNILHSEQSYSSTIAAFRAK